MLVAVGRTIGGSLIVLILTSAAVFFAGSALAPGSIVTTLLGGETATTEQIERLTRELGLDRPLVVQYFDWAIGAVQGDFGISPITRRRVTDVIAQELPVTFEVAFLGKLLSMVVGLPLGVAAAVWAGRWKDYGLRAVALTGLCIPTFVSGTILILVSAKYAPGLLSATFVPFLSNPAANLSGILLPVVVVAIPHTALLTQMTRGTMLDSLSQPYVAMANARGIPRWRLYYVHALKNALPPIITYVGFTFAILLGSMLVVESVFNLPGLGRGLFGSLNQRDYVVVQAEVMVLAVAFVVANLVVDLTVTLIDPRKRSA